MKRNILISPLFIGLLFVVICTKSQAGELALTQEQFDNIDKIDAALRKKYAKFEGFNGSREKMEAIGLPAAAVRDEISKLNFTQIESEEIELKQEIALVREKIIDMAITEAEKTGALKHKKAVKDQLLEGR